MSRPLREMGEEHVRHVTESNRRLIERALLMRCHSYLADVKSKLLTRTIYELDGSKKVLKDINERLAHEIKERQRIEAEAREARQRAEEANAAKSHFVASVSHDLRTPLNVILGFSEIIRDGLVEDAGPDDVARFGANIHAAALELLQTVDELLDLAKLESGRIELTESPFDLIALVHEVGRTIAGLAARKPLKVVVEPAGGQLIVVADRHLTKRMLVNLATNSVKFTPEGGQVTLSVSRAPSGEARISVADTGVGMDPEDIPRALEPFGAARTKEDLPHGTGLGLHISRLMTELHGGRMEVESARGKGTTVHALYPAGRVLEPA